jgi:hypothetical protein
LHDADWTSRKEKALIIKTLHQDIDTLIDFAHYIFSRDLAIFENKLTGLRSSHTKLIKLLSN